MSAQLYDTGAPAAGKKVYDAVQHVIAAKKLLAQAFESAVYASNAGANGAALETNVDFGVAAGGGAAFYTALQSLITNLNTVTEQQCADFDGSGQ